MKEIFSTEVCISIISVFLNSFDACSPSQNKIKSLQIQSSLPVITRDGILLENDDFFNVYYSGDLCMYQFRNYHDSSSNGQLVESGYNNSWFVHKKEADSGYYYSYHEFGSSRRTPVDSLLNARAFQNFNWHILATTKKVAQSNTDKNGRLTEMYVGPNSYNHAVNDTVIFYYDNAFKKFDYSFSPILDSLKRVKLYKIEMTTPAFYSEEYKINFPRKFSWLQMKDGQKNLPPEVEKYFDKFQRE